MRTSWTIGSIALALGTGLFGGCRGDIGDSLQDQTVGGGDLPGGAATSGPSPADCAGAAAAPGPSPIRRLTILEYDNTVHDLLNDTTAPARAFPEEERGLGFTNNAIAQSVSGLLIESYDGAAADLATAATGDVPKLMGCDPDAAQGDSCVRSFVTAFGRKAYRRSLRVDEVDRLVSFYTTSRQAYDTKTAARMTVQAMLESPYFLYRVEPQGSDTATRLSGYEIATRLSYLFWSSMPDAELLDAAASGKLDTADGIAAEAGRLFRDPRAHRAVETLFTQWLGLDGKVDKDAKLFPKFTPDVQSLLHQEAVLFSDDVVFGGSGLHALLSGNYTFMNQALASFYGVKGPAGAAFEKVILDPSQRAGILTQAGIMATYAKVNQTSPVARGHFVRESLLCDPPPPPPPNIPPLSPPDPSLTTRERLTQHRTNAACSSCHSMMDPIGFGFEHFDAEGLWRTSESGKPIDATGEIVQTSDANGTFDGAVELATKLSASAQVRTCAVKQSFRFAYGRGESDVDRCTIDQLEAAFTNSGGDFSALLLALTKTDPFLYRSNEVTR